MNKTGLLKSIAQAGYNIGFGGKKHFLTYDLYRILPKFLSFWTLAIGIFQLTRFYRNLVTGNWQDALAVALVLIGLIALLTDFAGKDLKSYNTVGKELLLLFNELRTLYNDLKYSEDNVDLKYYSERLKEIEAQAKQIAISEQAICTQIVTNISFFSTMQIDWIDEQLHFTINDKFPFYHPESIALYLLIILVIIYFAKVIFKF